MAEGKPSSNFAGVDLDGGVFYGKYTSQLLYFNCDTDWFLHGAIRSSSIWGVYDMVDISAAVFSTWDFCEKSLRLAINSSGHTNHQWPFANHGSFYPFCYYLDTRLGYTMENSTSKFLVISGRDCRTCFCCYGPPVCQFYLLSRRRSLDNESEKSTSNNQCEGR